MKVYILTSEEINNSIIRGVYEDEKIALDTLSNAYKLIHPNHLSLVVHFNLEKWETETNELEARWTNQRYTNEWTIEEHDV